MKKVNCSILIKDRWDGGTLVWVVQKSPKSI
jgi:hypothetical protein